MPIGLLTGLGAALAWGTLDVFSALASRQIGSLRVTTGVQLVGAALIWVLALARGVSFPSDPAVLIGGSLVGLAGAGAYLAYFTGLRIGPIAVVSGMVAAYGGLTVVLAVLIRGESLTPLQALGATVATVGVILTGVAFGGGLRGVKFAGPGVAFAIVALVLFAVMTIGSDVVLERTGWIEVLLVSRSANAVISVLVLIVAMTVLRGPAAPLLQGEDGGRRPDRHAGHRGRGPRGRARRHRPHVVRLRARGRGDVAGRPGFVVRSGGHDRGRRRVPRGAAEADPVARPGRGPGRDDRDRPAVAGRLSRGG